MTTPTSDAENRKNRYGFVNLLIWLFVYLLVGPFLGFETEDEFIFSAKTVFSVFITAVLFSAAYMINRNSHLFKPSIIVLALTLSLIWLDVLHVLELPVWLTSTSLTVYMGILVFSVGRYVIKTDQVTVDVICAALCIYLFIGLMWGGVFMMIESIAPGSFAGGAFDRAVSPEDKEHYLRYFSFVTLSTLGYGDITPQTPGATALCQAEAVIGQFFALVLVARLVGLHVAQETMRKTSRH